MVLPLVQGSVRNGAAELKNRAACMPRDAISTLVLEFYLRLSAVQRHLMPLEAGAWRDTYSAVVLIEN